MSNQNLNLYAASHQWATRPDDQRFASLAEMLAATRHYRDTSREEVVPYANLVARAGGDGGREVEIVGKAGNPARLTHWAFGQVSRAAGAPADYLRTLPSDLASVNLNHGLARLGKAGSKANLLIHRNGGLVLRSLASEQYGRIWDCEVVERLSDLGRYGWRVPPARPCREGQAGARPATQADVLANRGGSGGLSINVGDMIAPAGLYASDHDVFVFMVNESARLDDGTDGGLSRGFFLTNSEVGGKALKLTTFLYRHVCGNHIVWGAEGVTKLKIVHRGNADARFQGQLMGELRRYAESSARQDEERIQSARRFVLGKDKTEVLDRLFKALRGDISQRLIEHGYMRAEIDACHDRTIDPNTAWGYAQGLTAHSQLSAHADERDKMDRAAGKVLALAF